MAAKYKIAVVQLDSQNDKMKNLSAISRYIDQAAEKGVRLVCFPEDMNLTGQNIGEGGGAEEIPGLTSELLIRKAREHGIYIHGGSFRTVISGEKRYHNTSILIGPDGTILAKYHKIHTFDVTLANGITARESEKICPGNDIVTIRSELGVLGFSICYDVRFPELYRLMALNGAQVIFTPADFTNTTGQAHWEILLRARAVENGCYIVAADQCGIKPGYTAHGHSMVIDPWGRILAQAGQSPEIIYAEIDLDDLNSVRQQIPSLKNRRSDLYKVSSADMAWPGDAYLECSEDIFGSEPDQKNGSGRDIIEMQHRIQA